VSSEDIRFVQIAAFDLATTQEATYRGDQKELVDEKDLLSYRATRVPGFARRCTGTRAAEVRSVSHFCRQSGYEDHICSGDSGRAVRPQALQVCKRAPARDRKYHAWKGLT
jgi:hypothetical protein